MLGCQAISLPIIEPTVGRICWGCWALALSNTKVILTWVTFMRKENFLWCTFNLCNESLQKTDHDGWQIAIASSVSWAKTCFLFLGFYFLIFMGSLTVRNRATETSNSTQQMQYLIFYFGNGMVIPPIKWGGRRIFRYLGLLQTRVVRCVPRWIAIITSELLLCKVEMQLYPYYCTGLVRKFLIFNALHDF